MRDVLSDLQDILARCEWSELAAIAQRAYDEITELRAKLAKEQKR